MGLSLHQILQKLKDNIGHFNPHDKWKNLLVPIPNMKWQKGDAKQLEIEI